MTSESFIDRFKKADQSERIVILAERIEVSPADFRAMLDTVSARWLDLEAFLAATQLVIRKNPANMTALWSLSWYHLRNAEYGAAKSRLRQLIAAWPNQADFRQELLRVEILSPGEDVEEVLGIGEIVLRHPLARASYSAQLELGTRGTISAEALGNLHNAIDISFADICRNLLSDGSVVSERSLSRFWKILGQILAAQSIALVGNGPSVKGQGLGPTIDQHDLVIRCNFPRLAGYEMDVGSKTDIVVFNESLFPALENRVKNEPNFAQAALISLHPDALNIEKSDEISAAAGVVVARVPVNIRSFLKRLSYGRPTTGVMTIIMLVALLQKKVSLFGFDFFKSSQTHYFGSDGQTFLGHDTQYENWLVEQFLMVAWPNLIIAPSRI